jgi:hypothetical protein
MNMKLGSIGLILAAIVLSGCATMSADECMSTDWTTVGYEDGVRGYTADRIGQHRKACGKHGVAPDFKAYQSGREQGLREYCQPGRGFDVGSHGGRYYGVCNATLEPDFLDAYNTGYQLYTLRSNVNRANAQINAKQNELDNIDEDIRNTQARLIAPETTTEQRIMLLADLKDLSERTGQIEAELVELYDARARYQVELENYQVAVADLGY